MLEITRLCTVFESFETMEDAREELGMEETDTPLRGPVPV